MSKCLIILSHKSCGSSVCLRLITNLAGARTVAKTRHFENETLYWTKAASLLERPQLPMHDSEVPLPGRVARQELIRLLGDNVSNYSPPIDNAELVFEGWRALCSEYQPIFVEKSPHHLYQRACLELIIECMQRFPDIAFHFVGLVRNPMDVVYSQWQRWRGLPERIQAEWLIAYQNLLEIRETLGERLTVVRYEDLVADVRALGAVLDFLGTDPNLLQASALHRRSVAKWRGARAFGFALAPEVAALGRAYGYQEEDLPTRSDYAWAWPLLRTTLRGSHRLVRPLRQTVRDMRQAFKGAPRPNDTRIT